MMGCVVFYPLFEHKLHAKVSLLFFPLGGQYVQLPSFALLAVLPWAVT